MDTNKKNEVINKWKTMGVIFIDESTVSIDSDVQLKPGCIIDTMTVLKGSTVVEANARIEAFSYIENSHIGVDSIVTSSRIINSEIEEKVFVGPYSYIRGNSLIKQTAQIGSYSEINDTTVGEGSKCKHVSYIGHTKMGKNVNIGAGTITCTYDGVRKYSSEIDDKAFVGSGTLIVAPIKIGNKAKTGAGSVVTKNVEDNQLVYGVPARYKSDVEQ